MKTILISGKSASGKDTFANMLKEKYEAQNKKVLILHFADLVKFYAKQYWGWNGEKDEKGRALLQEIGTHIMRKYDDKYWGNIIGELIGGINEYDWYFFDRFIIPDWRFISEFESVSNYCKVITVRINRKDENGNYYMNPNMNHGQRWHQSEIELDDFNFEWIIENCGDLEQLKEAADYFIKEIG